MNGAVIDQHAHKPLESDGHIELLAHLGTGGFARTFLARAVNPSIQERWGTDQVALKIPLDQEKQRALIHEVELNAALHAQLRGLRSTNIVRYLGADQYRGQLVMATEYQPGGSLRERIGRVWAQQPLPVDEAVEIALGTLRGLQVLGDLQVLHRDIKPENILLQGRVAKVTDFGISRILDSSQQAKTITGTWYYTAPEILGRRGANFQADIWSLGVTLYEMLTGRFPFGDRNTTVAELLDQIRDPDLLPPLPCEVNPKVSPQLSAVVLHALCKKSTERYATAADMCRDLERLQRPQPRVEAPIATRDTMEDEDTEKSERSLSQRIVQHPHDTAAYRDLAAFYRRWTRYTEAIETCQRGLAIDARNAQLHLELAKVYRFVGRERQAMASLRCALNLGLGPTDTRSAELLQPMLERALA